MSIESYNPQSVAVRIGYVSHPPIDKIKIGDQVLHFPVPPSPPLYYRPHNYDDWTRALTRFPNPEGDDQSLFEHFLIWMNQASKEQLLDLRNYNVQVPLSVPYFYYSWITQCSLEKQQYIISFVENRLKHINLLGFHSFLTFVGQANKGQLIKVDLVLRNRLDLIRLHNSIPQKDLAWLFQEANEDQKEFLRSHIKDELEKKNKYIRV